MTNLEVCSKKVTEWTERPNGLIRFSCNGEIIARIWTNIYGMTEYSVRAHGTVNVWCIGWGDNLEHCQQSVDATLMVWNYNLNDPIPEKFTAMF